MHFLLSLFAAAFTSFAPARAETAFIPPMPISFEQVDFYLLTVGRGDQIYALFGHTILRVVDRKNGLDMNFNWGIFDFNDAGFAWKFYVGDLNYMMDITDLRTLVKGYGKYEHRRLTQERLNLTLKQKETLMRRLVWNSKPENLHYQYKQVRDNCSTKPRDYIDEALSGGIRKIYGEQMSRQTFRPYIRDGARQFWWADIGMDMLLNSSYDVPLTAWEEMFLPAKLREHLMSMPAYDDEGKPIPGKNLLDDTEILVDLPEPLAPRDPYFPLAIAMLVPLVGLWWRRSPYPGQASVHWTRALGVVTMLFGFWSGLFGLSMTTNWLISRYTETWANANMLMLWPVDWFFALWGLKVALTGRVFPETSRWASLARHLSRAHIVGIFALILFWAVGIVRQDVTPVIATSGLAGLLLYGLLARKVA